MTKTLAHGYSSDGTQLKLSNNEYQHDRVQMVFKNLHVSVLWMNVALAMEGLINLWYGTYHTRYEPFTLDRPNHKSLGS